MTVLPPTREDVGPAHVGHTEQTGSLLLASLVFGFPHQSKGYALCLIIIPYKHNTKPPLSAKFFVWFLNNMLGKFCRSCL